MKLGFAGSLAAVAVLLAGCGATVETRTESAAHYLRRTTPLERAGGANLETAPLAAAKAAIAEGDRLRHHDQKAAAGCFVSAIELALLAPNGEALANAALTQWMSMLNDVGPGKISVGTPQGPQLVRIESEFESRRFDKLLPSEFITAHGFTEHVTTTGAGVPLVGVFKDSSVPFYLKRGTFTPVTVVAKLSHDGKSLVVDLRNPKADDAKLAADFTAPVALTFDGFNDLALGIKGLLFVGNQEKLAGLYMLEPYDPDRIPVVMVHGLSSSPLIWRNMINELQKDPEIRKRYQFWVIYYPSGVPILTSAYFLRKELAAIRAQFDPAGNDIASRDLVTFGHSMGGVITRMNAVEIGDNLWNQIADKPFDQVHLTPEDREKIALRIFWEPIPQLHESIYFSAPHRGATMADSSLANLGMRLIRFPGDVFKYQKRMIQTLSGFLTLDFHVGKLFNSVGSLSPDNPVYPALDKSPFKEDFVFYTVVGDRGKGDTPDSSDGIVGYWSSHLDGAQEEIVVPTGHESFKDPNAIELSRHALLKHAKSAP